MIRQLPIIPTIIVLAAAGVMVWLGFWQLGRAEEKEALIARYSTASKNQGVIDWSGDPAEVDELLYRRVRVRCEHTLVEHGVAGRNASGQTGYVQPVLCYTSKDQAVRLILGWTATQYARPLEETTEDDRLVGLWEPGVAIGIMAPGPRLVADPPLGGLKANAKPDPNDLPNNHLAYAGQWFFFALTALLIYGFAVRARIKKKM